MKKLMFLIFAMLSLSSHAQEIKYQLSTHILDISQGHPSEGVKVRLEKLVGNQWESISEGITNKDGRIGDFLKYEAGNTDNKGVYRLTFFTKPYFEKNNLESFYPFIEVTFEIKDDMHYHVPITLSPFGYSTYRGS